MFKRKIKATNNSVRLEVERIEFGHVVLTAVFRPGDEVWAVISSQDVERLANLKPDRRVDFSGRLKRAVTSSNYSLGEVSLYFEKSLLGSDLMMVNYQDLKRALLKPWWWPF